LNSWKCDHLLGSKTNQSKVRLFCDKCNTIQALDNNQNYFELFDLNVSFDVDLLELTKQFRSLQMLSHPDKFGRMSEVSYVEFKTIFLIKLMCRKFTTLR